MASAPTNPILIVGAGISGLLFAQGLKRASVPFRIFERDSSFQHRSQGYRVRITDDGVFAIKRTVAPELFKLFEDSRAPAELVATRMNALTGVFEVSAVGPAAIPTVIGTPIPAIPPPAASEVCNVDRNILRIVLSHGFEDLIEFGKAFEFYSESADGVTVHFQDGTCAEGSLLVGADGARSLVRAQYLPEHRPLDSQWRAIFGKTLITDELRARFPANAMKWVTIISDPRPITLFLEPVRFPKEKEAILQAQGILCPADYIYWDIGGLNEFFPLSDRELVNLSPEEAAKLSLELTEDWHPDLRALFELQTPEHACALRIATHGAAWPDWPPSARITLIGDAVHAMTPAGGSGTTTALGDAASLCASLVEGGINSHSVGTYERKMRELAQDAIVRSALAGSQLYKLPPLEELKPLQYGAATSAA